MKKLLFFDIDGTLVDFGNSTMSPSTADALINAKQNGHMIFLCTGRSYNQIYPSLKAFDFDGVDIDWEYPRTTDGSKQQYEDFLLRLRRLLSGKLLTAAILAGLDGKNEPSRSAAEAIDFPAVELLDQINLMT